MWSREQGANFTLTPTTRGGLFNSTLIVTTIVVCKKKKKGKFIFGINFCFKFYRKRLI
jgi:hypothetical protein